MNQGLRWVNLSGASFGVFHLKFLHAVFVRHNGSIFLVCHIASHANSKSATHGTVTLSAHTVQSRSAKKLDINPSKYMGVGPKGNLI